MEFFFSSRTKVTGWAQPLTEMSPRNLPEGKGRSKRKTDNFTASVSLDVLKPCGPPWPVTGIALGIFFALIRNILEGRVIYMKGRSRDSRGDNLRNHEVDR
jgi:hypothetical protein